MMDDKQYKQIARIAALKEANVFWSTETKQPVTLSMVIAAAREFLPFIEEG